MAMKNILYFSIFLQMALFTCCKKENNADKDCCFVSKYFMPAYMLPDTLKAGNSYPIENNRHKINLKFKGFFISEKGELMAPKQGFEDLEERSLKFKELSQSYGDTTYNDYKDIGFSPALGYPIKKISIVSNKDYDSNHPAGTDLSDVIECSMSSYWHHIKNNYRDYNYYDYYVYCSTKEYCIIKKVADLDSEDLKIVGAYVMSLFIPDLDLDDTHDLTITIHFENGKTLCCSVQVDFSTKYYGTSINC